MNTVAPNSPSEIANAKPAATNAARATMGRSTSRHTRAGEAPSTAADSRRRSSIERSTGVITRTTNGTATTACAMGMSTGEPRRSRGGSPVLIPIAHAVVAVPFVVRVMTPVLRSIDERLRESAAVLGASPARVWREVDLPIVARAALVAAGFAFAISLGEFGATVFIARPDYPTLPIVIFR